MPENVKAEEVNGKAEEVVESAAAPAEEANAAEPAVYTLTQEQYDEVKAKIEALTKERDEMLATAQRVQADFDNFRRRNASVRADSLDEGARNTVEVLLPIADNLERALDAAKDDQSALSEGLRMIVRQLSDAFAKLGVTPIEAVGKPFDPNFHNAVMTAEAQEGTEPGTVTEEFQKGYTLKDKVIRHSMVKVSS